MEKAPKGTKTKPTKRGLYTSATQQAVVMAKSLVGMSQREIAESEGLHRRTVKRILSQQEFREAVQEGRSRFFGLIPKALEVYEKELGNKRRTKEKFAIARHVVDGTQVAVPRAEQAQGSIESEIHERSEAELEFAMRFKRWPTQEELECHEKTGRWQEDGTPDGDGS